MQAQVVSVNKLKLFILYYVTESTMGNEKYISRDKYRKLCEN